MRKLFSTLAAVFVTGIVFAGSVQAQDRAYVWSNRLGYTGTINRFATLGDAQANTNAVSGSPFAVPQRDLGLFLVNNNAAFAGAGYPSSAFDFLTAWYLPGSPFNQNTGFVQISDEDAGSVTSASGLWTNAARTSFQYSATGANTAPNCAPYTPFITEDCPRLWNSGSALGSAETTLGVYRSYEFSMQANFLNQAAWNPVTGVFESTADPLSVSGFFRGLFENTSVDDPASRGFYRVNLALNLTSWAAQNNQSGTSYFGSATVVPEPSTYALMAVGLAGLFTVSRRRRRSM